MIMNILRVTPDDFDDVLTLNEASVPHVSSIGVSDLEWFAEHAAFFRIVRQDVREDTRLAGFIIGLRPGTAYASLNYRWFCDNRDDFAYVDRVAVAAWARRRGIANALYDEFAKSQSGAPIMTCEVNLRPPNEGSMHYHEQLGFRQVAAQEIDGGKKKVAMLEKELRS